MVFAFVEVSVVVATPEEFVSHGPPPNTPPSPEDIAKNTDSSANGLPEPSRTVIVSVEDVLPSAMMSFAPRSMVDCAKLGGPASTLMPVGAEEVYFGVGSPSFSYRKTSMFLPDSAACKIN